jgi:POT family proton-dependent oligopeptide transporter
MRQLSAGTAARSNVRSGGSTGRARPAVAVVGEPADTAAPVASPDPEPPASGASMPPQIPFIIANEGCERFSFYGMKNILTEFLKISLLLHLPLAARDEAATEVLHTFVIGVYFFPLIGAFLADRFFGKYSTILGFSLIYSLGQGCLALFIDDETGFYVGLTLIALGSGGIKPLVASFVGDQFDHRTKHLAKLVFDAFYWMINFGSFFASLLMPLFLHQLGPRVAFGVPGALMLIATLVLWLGRRRYVMVPPAPPSHDSFLRVVMSALGHRRAGDRATGTLVAGIGVALAIGALAAFPWLGVVSSLCLALVLVLGFGGAGTALQLDRARRRHPDAAVDGVRAVLRVLIVFGLITPFFSLFDQKASTWVLQAGDMTRPSWFWPSFMLALNPALVLVLIPLNNLVLYPWLGRRGYAMTALRKMTWGIALAGVAYLIVGAMQLIMDGGTPLSVFWQILPYVFLTLGEVLVSTTGLEFAYSQAPLPMKSVIMSFWNLTVTMGNLWVLLAQTTVQNKAVTDEIGRTGLSTRAFLMFFFAGFALIAALAFRAYARRYREVEHYRPA